MVFLFLRPIIFYHHYRDHYHHRNETMIIMINVIRYEVHNVAYTLKSYCQQALSTSSVATGGHARVGTCPTCPDRIGSWDSRRSEDFWAVGGWIRRTDSTTNLHRKAFDSCKLSICMASRGFGWDVNLYSLTHSRGFAPDPHRGSASGPCWGSTSVSQTPCAHPDFSAWLRRAVVQRT